MSWLSKIFGSGPSEPAALPSEDYNGFTITPNPMPEGGEFRVAALIEKDGRSHQLVRADTSRNAEDCASASVAKAKQMIDEQGDGLFGSS